MGTNSVRRALIEVAWSEWRNNASYQGNVGVFDVRPPRWFVQDELGFALDAGPSLQWTCTMLERYNKSAMAQLGRDAPKRFTYPIKDTRARSRRPTNNSGHARRGASLSQALTEALARWGVKRHGQDS